MTHESDISPLTRLVARIDRASVRLASPLPASDSLPTDESPLLSTGFPSIDRALGGGLRRGDLTVIGGDDSSGCSALVLSLALRANHTMNPVEGRTARALLFTSETQPERVYEKVLSMSARVPLEAIQLGAVSADERTRLATSALALRDRVPVVETVSDRGIIDILEIVEATADLQLVIVDSLEGLLNRDNAPVESLAYAVLTLKRLALKRNIALLLTSHLSGLDQARRDRRPTLKDFGLGGAVGAHADLILGLYREELYDGDLGVTGAAELLILKHRHGPRGYVDLYFDTRFGRFEDVLEE